MGSKSVIVAGFHRSGTSLTSQLLYQSGLFLGYQLLGADASNVYGHAEDTEIIELHDDILASNGLTWQVHSPTVPEVSEPYRQRMRQIIDRREGDHEVWGFKDPRVCLFLDVWKDLLPDAKVLIVYRSPVETTSSLHKRSAAKLHNRRANQEFHSQFQKVPDLALNMWLTYNASLLDFAHRHSAETLAVSFDTLRRRFPLIKLLNQQWDLGLEDIATSQVFDPEVTKESDGRLPVANTKLIDKALGIWEALEKLNGEAEQLLGTTVMGSRALTEHYFRNAGDMYGVFIENELQSNTVEFLRHRTQELEKNQEELRRQLKRKRIQLKQEQMKHEQTQKDLEKAQKLADNTRQ